MRSGDGLDRLRISGKYQFKVTGKRTLREKLDTSADLIYGKDTQGCRESKIELDSSNRIPLMKRQTKG